MSYLKKLLFTFIFSASFLVAVCQPKDTLFNKLYVLKSMRRVASWQLTDWKLNGSKWPIYDWTNATGYVGLLEYARIIGDSACIHYILKVGEDMHWNTGPRRTMADDYCIGQVYAELYRHYLKPEMIIKFKKQADTIASLPHTESLAWKNGIQNREWAWCDAMFMGPTGFWCLSSVAKDMKYGNTANKLWWKTYAYLYDRSEHLYYRDSSYFTKREANGKKVFWSRGNGWVLGGLVRILANMPADYPDRPKYVQLYNDMVSRIASLQQPDGSWHASLLDPANYPIKEASGTGFYTYAILWGLNHGILDGKKYWPIVKKSWAALNGCIQPDGMLGFVQKVGAAPDKTDANSTEIYGVGAFLLAGTQLYTYLRHHPRIH